jgi:hypothetical protein
MFTPTGMSFITEAPIMRISYHIDMMIVQIIRIVDIIVAPWNYNDIFQM